MAQSSGNVRQRQAVETRLHLLAAAADVFEEKGYQATSVGAITERANTAHGTFYLYFKNKEDAFCQVMETAIIGELGGAAGPVNPAGSTRDIMEQMIRGFFDAYVPRIGLWRAVLEGALVSPRVQTIWLELRRVLVERVAFVLKEGQAAGQVRPLDATLTAHALCAMVDWFSFLHLGFDEPPRPDGKHDDAIDVLVDLWHHAVFGKLAD